MIRRAHVPLIVLLIVAAVLFVVFGGCASRRDHTELLRDVETKEMVLDPRNTRGPELRLRVPSAFESDWTANVGHDSFIIFDPDDDESGVQRGMLVVNVTSAPISHIDDTLETRHVRSMIADGTVEWRERSFEDDDGMTIHQRETTRAGLFDLYKDPKTGGELVLHIFVVGSDSVLVERLMGSAETIVAGGGRPDA